MGALAGRKCVITIGGSKLKGVSKNDIAFSAKSIDCTEYDPDNDWTKSDVGMSSAKITFAGFMRVDDLVQTALRAKAFTKEVIQDLKIYHDYAGGHYYAPDIDLDPEAGARISDLKVGATVAGMVTVDFTLENYGPWKEV
jgi:predicted secreted protein